MLSFLSSLSSHVQLHQTILMLLLQYPSPSSAAITISCWTIWENSVFRDLPNPGIELRSPAFQPDSLPSEPPGKPKSPLKTPPDMITSFPTQGSLILVTSWMKVATLRRLTTSWLFQQASMLHFCLYIRGQMRGGRALYGGNSELDKLSFSWLQRHHSQGADNFWLDWRLHSLSSALSPTSDNLKGSS